MIKTMIKHIQKKTFLTTAKKATHNYYNKNAKKITTHLEMQKASLDIEFPLLMGPCVVFGSAPTATLPKYYDNNWTLITVNAAQAISNRFGCKIPDATIMTSGILTDNLLNEGSKKALNNLQTNRLVLINSMSFIQAKSVLSDMCYNYSDFIPISVAQRAKLTKHIYGRNLYSGGREYEKLSTGLFAVTLMLYMKIEPIIMCGFSFTITGHGYDDSNNIGRPHVKNDALAIEHMKRRMLPVYAADEKFANDTGLKMWGK